MRKFLRGAAIIYAVYLALTLLVITPALNFLPQWYMKKTYGREFTTKWVLLNPFTLSLDIKDAQLHDDTGARFLAFSNASVNLSTESLWQPGWVLDAVTISDLYLEVTRIAEDEYNISDLMSDDSTVSPAAKENTAIPGVTIHNVDLHSDAIVLTDKARKSPYTSRWNGLHIQVDDISTVFEEGRPFRVAVEAEGGGKLQWEGDISVPGSHSSGKLSLSNLDLHKVWLFAEDWLSLEVKQGRLLVEGEYEANWKDALNYRVSKGHIGISNLDIVPQSPEALPDTAVRLKALDIADIALNSESQAVSIDTVNLDQLAVNTWMEDATVSLQQLFAVNLPDAGTDANADTSGPPWSVALNTVQLHNSSLQWRSEFTDPQMLNIAPLEASVEHLTWPLSGETRLSLNLAVNEQAKIVVDGTLALDPGDGSIEYSLEGLPLTWFNPNLPKPLKATITGGQVELKGNVALQEYAPTTIALDGKIRDFSARRQDTETQLTGFELVSIKDLAVDMTQHSVELKKLTIDTYIGRLHIHEDGSINASNIWKEEVGEQAQQIAEKLTEDKPWTFSIPIIRISDSAVDFMDESLPIKFRTVIGDLEGEVRNLGSDPESAATVDINGSVDGYAPVTLNGEVTPMATPTNLDLTLVFDGVDMALLSPYSGTYAGYVIDRGLLDLNLHYALKDNKLKGDNAIRIEKLKLGEKIESDKAVDLPLQLALAILTDANGVIEMAVPVKGNVNDPKFDVGGVIVKAFINLITKAITAPFTLLAGLVDTEEDLQRLSFTSGSSVLNDKSREKLNELAKALEQRPKLSLVITGRLNITPDRERLQRNALRAQLQEAGLSSEEIKAKGPDWEAAIAERFESLPSATAAAEPLSPSAQYAQVWRSIDIPDSRLTDLAGKRAAAVKRYLVTEAGLAQERAVVGQSNLKDSDNAFSGVELSIDN
ncbi:MAG: DUF748 domain-containing protein [Halioglobus sp.]